MRTRPEASGPGTIWPGTMPLLGRNRKESRGRSGRTRPAGHIRPKTLLLWPYRGRSGSPRRALFTRSCDTLPSDYGLVVRPAAALRRNPIYVAVGVLHVAGF